MGTAAVPLPTVTLRSRPGCEEVVAPLGVPEAGQVDRDQVGVLGQA
jgi:hypothetical protein